MPLKVNGSHRKKPHGLPPPPLHNSCEVLLSPPSSVLSYFPYSRLAIVFTGSVTRDKSCCTTDIGQKGAGGECNSI
jgi:hypothetical protein